MPKEMDEKMKESLKKHYFMMIKFTGILFLLGYILTENQKSLKTVSLEWFLIAFFLFFMVCWECTGYKKCFLAFEAVVLSLFFLTGWKNPLFLFLLVLFYLDFLCFLELSFLLSFFTYLILWPCRENVLMAFIFCSFFLIIYYQHYGLVLPLEKEKEAYIYKEYELKNSIDRQEENIRREALQRELLVENKILAEREKLFQELHDKLGHSINGSVYQLEAVKVLLPGNTGQSLKMLELVIKSLRGSMDELRMIFRKKKPGKKQLAIASLQELCEKCREEYGIDSDCILKGEVEKIGKDIWEVLLDNTFEAVSNALKYSGCSRILVEIVVLNQRIRCTVSDNGRGCLSIQEGMGIEGMRRRVKKVGGIFSIDGTAGFEITMLFPRKEEEKTGGGM